MKKIAVILTAVVIFAGCSTTKPAIAPPPTQAQTQEEKVLYKPWDQRYLAPLGRATVMQIPFYNGSEIQLAKTLKSGPGFFVKDGVVNIIDTTHDILKKIPKFTVGKLIDIHPRATDQVAIMTVLFSVQDETYRINFEMQPNGSFLPVGEAKLVFQNTEYRVPVYSTPGEQCYLMIKLNKVPVVDEVRGQAEGVTP